MTITVNIRSEVQAELARRAASRGRAVEEYAAALLEEAAHISAETIKAGAPAEASDLYELFAPVRGLFADGELDFSRNPSTGRPIDLL